MSKKPKFKPVINRVELNPEQAVLACQCYSDGWYGVWNCGMGWGGAAVKRCSGLGAKSYTFPQSGAPSSSTVGIS